MAKISGGEKLEAALRKISTSVSKGALLKVGFLSGATYPDGTSVAMVAAIQNYGSGTIPPRPFFSNMVAAKSKEWPGAIAGLLVANDYDAEKTLQITGQAISGQLKQAIRDTSAPPLAPSTIARKGFSKPLIDTGQMLNSVDFEVTT